MPILLVKVNTNNVQDTPARWRAGEVVTAVADDHEFGNAEVPAAGNFYHVSITDKTLEEVQTYLQDWKHNPAVTQISKQGDNRLIEVTSDMVSATGKNAFTQAGVGELMIHLNSGVWQEEPEDPVPDYQATYVSHTTDSFRFSIVEQNTYAPGVTVAVEEAVRNMQYGRRRWYINSAGMTYLGNNGGAVSGTATQVAGYLRDGLLD